MEISAEDRTSKLSQIEVLKQEIRQRELSSKSLQEQIQVLGNEKEQQILDL